MTGPLIGISGRSSLAGRLGVAPKSMAGRPVDLYFRDYALGVLAAGGLPVYMPEPADPEAFVGRLDGLLLTGGTDIDPARYGQEVRADLFPPEPGRDAFELGLMDAAAASGIPVAGICRGIQILNVHGGGTLHQHIGAHACFDEPPDEAVHTVTFAEGSQMAGLYGPARRVNSLHHQTIDEVGEGLLATGRSEDGAVEAIEAVGRPWLGVQWHPEMMDDRDQDPLFSWLVAAAAS